jgi:hypothetical protein
VNDGRTSLYDDLAIEPDSRFERALRRRLDHDLRAVAAPPLSPPVELDFEFPEPPLPEARDADERGRWRRSLIAVAAAIAATTAVGLVVDRLFVDDSTEPPTATVPPTTSPKLIVESPTTQPTTTQPSYSSDDVLAIKSLLWDTDPDIEGVHAGKSNADEVRLVGSTADVLPACKQFASTVFESAERPAAINSRLFFGDDSVGIAMFQYVAVLPTVEKATAMLDGIQDPDFLAGCVPAYNATFGPECCEYPWFPFLPGKATEPPAISVDADDIWVRRFNESWNDQGEIRLMTSVAAAIRVGRIVTVIDLRLTEPDHRQLATVEQFEAILQRAAERARDAQSIS